MSTLVEYVLGVRDNLSAGVDNAKNHVNQLESAVGGVKSALGALGVAFGVFEIATFIKEGVEKYHELEMATAKVEANLRSTKGVAGLGMDELGGFAKDLSSKIQNSRAEVIDMQSQLLTFPAISKDVFQQSMGLVADLSKQTGHGLSETAIMYGKALNSPIDGLAKMSRYGVVFTASEKEKISHLQASGHLIEAQKAMMDAIAHSGYAGVAEAMFNADPIARFNKMIGSAKVEVGEYATEILKKIMPALISMAQAIKDVVKFIAEHATALGILVGIYVTYKAATLAAMTIEQSYVAIKAVSAAWTIAMTTYEYTRALGLGVLTSAQYALNTAMELNPIGLVIAGIAALVAIVYELYQHFDSVRIVLDSTWGAIKAFGANFVDLFTGLGHLVEGLFNPAKMVQGMAEVAKAVGNIKEGFNAGGEGAKGYLMYGSDADKAIGKSLTDQAELGEGTKVKNPLLDQVATPKTKAEGQKTINIHVAYNAPLIQGFTISTTNVKEGFDELKTKVTAILTGATHDSVMVADN